MPDETLPRGYKCDYVPWVDGAGARQETQTLEMDPAAAHVVFAVEDIEDAPVEDGRKHPDLGELLQSAVFRARMVDTVDPVVRKLLEAALEIHYP